MGCVVAKQAPRGGDDETKTLDGKDSLQPDTAREASALAIDAAEQDVSVARHNLDGNQSRGHQAGFRHTSGLRVGVIESKETSVTLLNDYIVLGSLGKGTYGSVKLCYSMQDDNLYALKVLQRAQLKRQMLGPRPGNSNAAVLDMLRREVDVMRSMNHPNLIKIFEVIEADSKVVLVQEYAEAGPLQQPDHVMCESLAQYYFRQIVAGLHCLHGQNVVHGDIKPDNVLLSGSGLVKIADFGQAQFFDEGADVFDKTLGTPAFMAPEVRSGDAYHGKPADMWALGVTLYCFMFGDLPFKGSTLPVLYEAIQTQEVRYPDSVPISDALRSVLDGLLNKDPEKRPTSLELLHHPWVAEPQEEGPAGGLDELPELSRLDDAPSLEKWMNEMALDKLPAQERLPVANEVAVSVFGRDMMENAQSINAQNIMEVIQEANTETSAFPMMASMTRGPTASRQEEYHDVLLGAGSSDLAPAWQSQQQELASPAASNDVQWRASNGVTVLGLYRPPAEALARGRQQLSAAGRAATGGSRGISEGEVSQEQLVAALDSLLIELGVEMSGDGLTPDEEQKQDTTTAWADVAAAAAAAEGGASQVSAGAQQQQPQHMQHPQQDQSQHTQQPQHTQHPHQQRVSPLHEPVALAGNGGQPSVSPFAGAAATRQPSTPVPIGAPQVARMSHSVGPPLSSPMSIPTVVRSSLPISPFESLPVGSASVLDAVQPASPLRHHISLGAPQSDRDISPFSGTSLHSPGAAAVAAGQRLQSTGEVWDAMRSKALRNKVPGVKFVSFPAGTQLDIPERAAGNYCLLIESGIVEVRYVTILDKLQINRQSQCSQQHSSRQVGSSSVPHGGNTTSSHTSSESEDEEVRLERRDSVARGPEAQAIAPSKKQRGLAPSPSLQDTVERVLARAERVLGTAMSNSEANMLSTTRGPNDFVGIAAMLEPAQVRKLNERWRAFFVARTEVRGVLLSRQAVELVLQHYPLAQVYLRITLSKGRAEVLQLESLEKIASCLKPVRVAGDSSRNGGARRSASSRLDLFRAVSFARQLAATLAENVTNLDPLTDAAAHFTDAAAKVPRFFGAEGSFRAAVASGKAAIASGKAASSRRPPLLFRRSGVASKSGKGSK